MGESEDEQSTEESSRAIFLQPDIGYEVEDILEQVDGFVVYETHVDNVCS